jgi:hypothetical protein
VLKWIVPTLIALAAREGRQAGAPPAAPKSDAVAELKAACAKIAEKKSYSFDSTLDNDAPAPGGGARDNTPVSGKVEIGGVAELKRGDLLAYRKGEKLASKKKDAWELFNPDAAPKGGGGGKGGRGYGGGGAGGSEAKEHGALKSLATMALPHEMLATFDTMVHDVKGTEADGKHTYTAALTDSAATELSGAKELNGAMGHAGGGGGGKGGGGGGGGGASGGGPFKATGTATVVIGKDGSLEKVVFETQVKNKTNEYKQKHVITTKEWGAAKITAPKEALSLIGG